MSQFYVTIDDSLGELRTADDPVAAARDFAADRKLAGGTVVIVRWNVRFHPRDPAMWLGASVREVTIEGAPAAPPAPPAEAPEAPAAKGKKAKAEAKAPEAAPPAPPAEAPPAEAPPAEARPAVPES